MSAFSDDANKLIVAAVSSVAERKELANLLARCIERRRRQCKLLNVRDRAVSIPLPLDLDDTDVAQLASGVSNVLAWYGSIGYNSFNLVLYSGPLGGAASCRVNLAMITRTALRPFYRKEELTALGHWRSHSMYLERLHWEAAVDRAPEAVAQQLRAHLQSA